MIVDQCSPYNGVCIYKLICIIIIIIFIHLKYINVYLLNLFNILDLYGVFFTLYNIGQRFST